MNAISDDDPDWSLLPGNPVGFFGLSAGFDGKELKRSYTRLIKRFKPEKSPDEFQQIRAAYDALEARLQRRRDIPQPTLHEWVVKNEESNTEETPPSPGDRSLLADGEYEIEIQKQSRKPPASPLLTVLERLRQSEPGTLLIELDAQRTQTNEEHLLATFLRDASSPENSTEFLDGLLLRFNMLGDEESFELLSNYLRSDEAANRCREFLLRIFATLEGDGVISMTEPLWVALASRVGFSSFLELWDQCLCRVNGRRRIELSVFEIRMLRRFMFYAPVDWISQQLARLSSGDVVNGHWLDDELILHLEQLNDYVRIRARFVKRHALAKKMDELIQEYCRDQPGFEERLFEFQVQIADQFRLLSSAIPRWGTDGQKVWCVWQKICESLPFPPSQALHNLQNLAKRELDRLTTKLARRQRPLLSVPTFWPWWAWLAVMLLDFGLPAWMYLYNLDPNPHANKSDLAQAMGIFGLVLGLTLHGAIGFVDVSDHTWLEWQYYCMGIRQQLAAFATRFPIPVSHLFGLFRKVNIGYRTQGVLKQFEHDYALRIYAHAVFFVRRDPQTK